MSNDYIYGLITAIIAAIFVGVIWTSAYEQGMEDAPAVPAEVIIRQPYEDCEQTDRIVQGKEGAPDIIILACPQEGS